MEQFYLDEVTIKNYRRFADKALKFDKQMNVLIGSNASGKTAVLEAVTVLLGAYLAAYKKYVPSRFVRSITESDVRRKNQWTVQRDVLLSPGIAQYPCSIGTKLIMDNREYRYKRVLEKKGGRTKFAGSNPMQKEIVLWENLLEQGDESDSRLVLPITLYLSSARLWNEDKDSQSGMEIPDRTDAYSRCLDEKRGIQLPFSYIAKLKEISLQEKAGEDFPAYTLIMDAIRWGMKDELKPGQTIEYSSRYNGLALIEEDGTWIPFASLSDGYRGVIKIIADIATRMCILNPYLKYDTLERTPGVVVIDELDLSLHPSWQRRIVNILTELFPKVQFICATHSPFIIQSLKDGQLISMDGEIEDEYAGQSIEDIAEDIMGIENPQYSDEKQEMFELAQEYFAQINQAHSRADLTHVRARLEMLTARFGDNPAYYAFLKQMYLEKMAELG
ncbi:AAA family ATPase [Enterocloster lavalensis]|uniref:AAA family ATPase n=1 Tax=Enterocloster lavalensis TaxID=460384 RepID=UPI002357DEEE|nr:AAA family ATPase [Enterocloster lavalensis]